MSKQKLQKGKYDCVAKVVILGDSAVGKTNILLRFAEGQYRPSHLATIGVDFKNKPLEIDGRTLKFQLWDTAGQQRFKTIAQTYYKNAAGIILVYSVGERKSFNGIANWISQINDNNEENIPRVLVGNKCDLIAPERTVTTEEGKMLAGKYGLAFIETSAQEDTNVKELFTMLGKQILHNDEVKRNKGVEIGRGGAKDKDKDKKCC